MINKKTPEQKIREYLINKYDSPALRKKIAKNIVFLRENKQ